MLSPTEYFMYLYYNVFLGELKSLQNEGVLIVFAYYSKKKIQTRELKNNLKKYYGGLEYIYINFIFVNMYKT